MLKIRAGGIVFLMARIDNGFEDCYDYREKPTFFYRKLKPGLINNVILQNLI
ncbi:hypothetical protein [Paenibacillus sp. RC343]|uniref:hypothetical protein n=1 Tax=Paenibacillus sp. RC343 TaxID=3045841 RepID=UPI0024B9302E|nr:hypothetical protein [Paenibacillus sp. RC343]